MPLTLQDRADIAWGRFRDVSREDGRTGRPCPINVPVGEKLAARHDFLLRLVCLEAGDGVAERLQEDLEEQVTPDDIGDDGCAAYFEARTPLAVLDAEAEVIGEVITAIHRFAVTARRVTMRRAFA